MDSKVLGLVEVLNEANTREGALDYIKANKVNVATIKAAAKELNIWVNSKWGKTEMSERLVEYTVGARLRIRALITN